MKLIFIVLGFLFLGLGVVGIYMPLLPATPFLLIAAACFGKGSEKFNTWFINTKIYKRNIKPLKNKEGMHKNQKIKILATIGVFLTISFIVMKNTVGRMVLVLVFIFHLYYFIFRVKTLEGKDID